MWEIVSRQELDQARQELRARRAAIMQRHAEELQQLDAERREIEDLSRLAAILSSKFGGKASPAKPRVVAQPRILPEPQVPSAPRVLPRPQVLPEPRVRWIVAPAGAMPATVGRTASRPAAAASTNRVADRRHRRVESFSGTNFDMFLRAVTDSSF